MVADEGPMMDADIPASVRAKLNAAKTALQKRGRDETRQQAREQQELEERLKSLRQGTGDYRTSKERHLDELAEQQFARTSPAPFLRGR